MNRLPGVAAVEGMEGIKKRRKGAITGFGTPLPAGRIPGPAGSRPNPSGSRRNGLEGVRTTPAIQIRSGDGCP